LETLCETGSVKHSVVREQISIYAPLLEDWPSFLSGLNGDLRAKIRRDRRIMNSNGGELRIIDSLDGFEEGFEIFINLHQARWTSRGKPGVFSSEKFTRFHREVAPKLVRKGWLKLFILFSSGEPVSALYLLTYNNKVSEYQSGLRQESISKADKGATI